MEKNPILTFGIGFRGGKDAMKGRKVFFSTSFPLSTLSQNYFLFPAGS